MARCSRSFGSLRTSRYIRRCSNSSGPNCSSSRVRSAHISDPYFSIFYTVAIITLVFGIYNVVMYFVYVKKVPFFQQYRVSHVSSLLFAEIVAMGDQSRSVEKTHQKNHWHCGIEHLRPDSLSGRSVILHHQTAALFEESGIMAVNLHHFLAMHVLPFRGGYGLLLVALSPPQNPTLQNPQNSPLACVGCHHRSSLCPSN